VHVRPDGKIVIQVNRLEFGQGVQTSLPALLADENRITGFCYDAAGNLRKQGTPCADDYTYDAESRLKTAAGGTYTYDGDGILVKKANAGPVIDQALYWGSSFTTGPLSETNLSGGVLREFFYFGNTRIGGRRDTSANGSTIRSPAPRSV
jgi:hypothetical protein